MFTMKFFNTILSTCFDYFRYYKFKNLTYNIMSFTQNFINNIK